MLDLFQRGGWTMWGLLAAAIVGLVYIIERFVTLTIKSRVNPQKFIKTIEKKLQSGGVEEAIAYCKRNPSPVAKIVLEGLKEYQKSGANKDAIEEALNRAAISELAFLDRGMPQLAAVVTLAPMMGFLGTVSGMISAFDAIAMAGTVEAKLVASGISEALITTMTGLVIAIPVAAAHVTYQAMINGYIRKIDEASNYLVKTLLEMGE